MSTGQHDGHLGKVYDAQAPEQVAAAYDAWAASYDAEMAAAGYRHPSIGCALLARHAPRGTGPVLDAGGAELEAREERVAEKAAAARAAAATAAERAVAAKASGACSGRCADGLSG